MLAAVFTVKNVPADPVISRIMSKNLVVIGLQMYLLKLRINVHCVSKKSVKFETVYLKI